MTFLRGGAVERSGAGSSSGVTSLNSETGAVTLTSADSSVTITTPTSTTINLKANVPNVLVYKGGIDCSTNPNYPAGTVGDTYVVTASGLIGGASGATANAGDYIICNTNNAGGTQASVGAYWNIVAGASYLGTMAAQNANNVAISGGTITTTTISNPTSITGVPTPSASTDAANKAYVDSKVSGALVLQGTIDCSTNPNYPAATANWYYIASAAGKIGGASGVTVGVGDLIICITTNAGGTQAAVGSSWTTVPNSASYGTMALQNANNVAITGGTISLTGNLSTSVAGATSSSPLRLSGTIYSGGTGTTTFPYALLMPSSATAATTWSTSGTMLGINTSTGFSGNFLDFRVNGGSSVLSVTSAGAISASSLTTTGAVVAAGRFSTSSAGAASTAVIHATGALYTAGTGTTNFPQFFQQPSTATAATTWSTSGTFHGVNAASGFTGNFLDFHINGGNSLFLINSNGSIVSSGNNTFAGTNVFSNAGAASTAIIRTSGAVYAAGTGTTNFPQYLAQTNGATAATTWSTAGTYFGVNADSGFAGNFFDFYVNGGTSVFSLAGNGNLSVSGNLNISKSPTASGSALVNSGTLFTGGTGTTTLPMYRMQSGAATAATTWSTSGTYQGINADSGFSGNFVDYRVNGGASLFIVNSAGSIVSAGNITAGASNSFVWNGRSKISSPSDGTITLQNNAATGFTKLALGSDVAAPTATTIQTNSVVAGTSNTAGTNLTIAGSQGTGTGAGGSILLQVAPAGTTGTSQNALITALTIDSTKAFTFADAANLVFNTTTGTKIGTATSQKIGFFNATPIVQPSGDIATALANLGLTAANPTLAASSLTGGTIASGVGFSSTPYSGGTISTGTYTPAASNGNQQYITNGGAFTLAPPSTACSIILEITNNGSAGAITTSSFTKVSGDSFTTTNTNKFMCFITKTQNYSNLNVLALQ